MAMRHATRILPFYALSAMMMPAIDVPMMKSRRRGRGRDWDIRKDADGPKKKTVIVDDMAIITMPMTMRFATRRC